MFGWYTNIPWKKHGGGWQSKGGESFIFKLLNDKKFKKLKNLDKKYDIQFDDVSSHIFWIGNSGNIAITEDCDKNK